MILQDGLCYTWFLHEGLKSQRLWFGSHPANKLWGKNSYPHTLSSRGCESISAALASHDLPLVHPASPCTHTHPTLHSTAANLCAHHRPPTPPQHTQTSTLTPSKVHRHSSVLVSRDTCLHNLTSLSFQYFPPSEV